MAVSGRMILKEAPLPEDIRMLGVNGVNQIWRNAKLRGAGMKRAKTLVSAAGIASEVRKHRKRQGLN